MTTKITRIVSHAVHALTTSLSELVDAATGMIHRLRDRHDHLMNDHAAYRAQLAAAAAAVIALIELPHTWATLVLAVVAIYIATFTPNEGGGWFRSSLDGPNDSYDRW